MSTADTLKIIGWNVRGWCVNYRPEKVMAINSLLRNHNRHYLPMVEHAISSEAGGKAIVPHDDYGGIFSPLIGFSKLEALVKGVGLIYQK
jgi:hypothetical protein